MQKRRRVSKENADDEIKQANQKGSEKMRGNSKGLKKKSRRFYRVRFRKTTVQQGGFGGGTLEKRYTRRTSHLLAKRKWQAVEQNGRKAEAERRSAQAG